MQAIIAQRKTEALKYEEYLHSIAALIQQLQAGHAPGTPAALDTPGKRALYNNLLPKAAPESDDTPVSEEPEAYIATTGAALDLALRLDEAVKQVRPDGWRGIQAREQVIKRALYDILRDVAQVERIFLVVKAQTEY